MLRQAAGLAALLAGGRILALAAENPQILTCDKLTLARPEQAGVTYKGLVSNSYYRFDATIPKGLVGLGAADVAPFHGFAIFLGQSACIVFEIQLIVVLPDDSPASPPERRVPVRFGNRLGLGNSWVGTVHGRRYLNTYVDLELPRSGYKNAASVYLVTPVDERSATEPVFRSFLASFKFW